MEYFLITMTIFVIPCLFIIGLIKPYPILCFSSSKGSRKKILIVYPILFVVFFMLCGIEPMITGETLPNNDVNNELKSEQSEGNETPDDAVKNDPSGKRLDPMVEETKAKQLKIEIQNVSVKHNSIGIPTIGINLFNGTDKNIDAFKIKIYAYNNFDEPLKEFGYGKEFFYGIDQDEIPSNEHSDINKTWTLNGFDTGKKFYISIEEIHFSDGTTWKSEEGARIDYNVK